MAQSNLRFEFNYDGSPALSLCGFIPNVIEDVGQRYQIEKCNCIFGTCNRPHWTENKNNNVICAGLSLDDPKSQLFVNACLRRPDFMVLCRKGADGRLIRSRPLYGSQRRRANTRAGLKTAPWDREGDVLFQDSILDEARPLISQGSHLEDCFQIAIVDGGEGDMKDFIGTLVEIWYQIYQVDDLKGLLSDIGGSYLDSGELEIGENKFEGKSLIVPNTEVDILASYKRLWRRGPREGRLADDESHIEIIG